MTFRPAVLLALAATAALPSAASPQLATQAGCAVCHMADKPMVGPSWQAVAAKYKGQAAAGPQLTERVRKGGVNVWGKVPMPPTPPEKISDADLKALIGWVLKAR